MSKRLRETFPVTIKKLYTDVDGLIIDKSVLPVSLQVEMPFYLFGKMDKDGAYKIATESSPPQGGWLYFKMQTASTYDFLYFTGVNTIQGQILTGDLVFIYTDSYVNPTYFCYIIVTSKQRSYVSIIDNLYEWGPIVSAIVYESQNINQYQEVIDYVKLDRTGLYKSNQFSPIDFRDPYVQQDDIIRMELERFNFDMQMTRFVGLNSYILFDTDTINFNIIYKIGQ